MRGLRLEDVSVAGVSGSLNLSVEMAQIRAVIVPASRIRAVADVLVGLEPPQSGWVKIDDKPVTGDHHRARQHGIRLVPSDGGLLPNLTVLHNILYAECVVHRRPSEHPEKEVRHSTAIAYGLNDVLDRFPYEITIGRRRMAGLARALRANPSVVVLEDDLDAPTWVALLGAAQPPADGDSPSTSAHTPVGQLSGVAAVLVTSDPARAQGLESPPAAFQIGAAKADTAHADTTETGAGGQTEAAPAADGEGVDD